MLLKVNLRSAGYDGENILEDIRFELPLGRILAVIGPNGSGKTTLIRAMSGVLPRVQGELFVNSTDLISADDAQRARLIAVVPQSTQIPPAFRVEEAIMMGRTPHLNWLGKSNGEDREIVRRTMEMADVTRLRERLCGELSAGESQRVILARALAQDTPVLLMDEPTSHLDLRYQVEFLELALRLAVENGKTVLAAIHDLNLAARFSDEVLALKDGRTAALGRTDEVLNAAAIERIYRLPVEVFTAPSSRQRVIIPS